MRHMRAQVAGVLAALLGGCAHSMRPATAAGEEPFRLGSEDVVEISVWRDPELSRTVPVRPDGYISMPMVGDIEAAGKTPNVLADDIKARLKPFVQEPRVTVSVKEVNSPRVTVMGEVVRPGAYPMRGRVSILQALALAGGFTPFSEKDNILIIRPGAQGGRFRLRYSDLIYQGEDNPPASDVNLLPGDTIVVP